MVDTSTLLTHLQSIRNIIEDGARQPVFLIPWSVLQEVDMIYGQHSRDVPSHISEAVDFLRSSILTKCPRVNFQSYEEVSHIC